jgi:hypothetical protein
MNVMTLRDAAAKLRDLSKAPVRGKYMMPRVNELLGEFEEAERRNRNGYALEKISEVRSWFDELGKLRQGRWSIEAAQAHAQESICKLEQLIDADGTRLRSLTGPPPEI